MADLLRLKMTFVVLILHLLAFFFYGNCTETNLAYKRRIDANTTCGNPPEEFFETWQETVRPHLRRPFICNASSPLYMHPPSFMVDGLYDTHWQAKADVDHVNITIDLASPTQKFIFVKTINIQFGAYQRPGQILFSKSTDGGLTYSPWHRYVTFPFECQTIFGVTYVDRPFFEDSVLCRTFLPSVLPAEGNETVTLDLYGGRSSRNSLKLQQWMNATNIKIQFTGLYKKFDIFSIKWHHYTVREINVTGSCFCNGHATSCNINATTGDRSCQCANNACGHLCDRCCPAFNQYQWKAGTGAPFDVDPAAACQPCNCYNHASSCVYNQTVADARMSLNSTGFYSGGGVCQNCQHNTTGINCEKCIPLLYRPAGKSQAAPDACTECNCSSLGSRVVPGVPYLDCIRDETVNMTGMNAGDCYCKQNVQGRRCDVCKPTFYNLSSSNPQGCQDCLCHTPGTINSSNVCSGDSIGNCPCKRNTEGRSCSVCKDQFFNLTRLNPDGCQDCNCDSGGRSSPVCNKTNGNCRCKSSNITGRKCDTLMDEFYFPSLHFISTNLNRITAINRNGVIHLPTINNGSGVYYVIIRYKSTINSLRSSFVLDTPFSSPTYSSSVDILSNCQSSCFAVVNRNFTLTSSTTWNIYLTFLSPSTNDAATIQIESVIFMPSEFYHATVLGMSSSSFLSKCNVVSNNFTGNDPTCVQGVFSLTMGLLGDAFACECNRTGSLNNVCAKYQGQCSCKTGVTGRQCDRCIPGFFNFSSNGCTPCNCSGDNKVCDSITGQCSCPVNTVGRTCSECASLHWGWNSTTGCVSCGCNNLGSANLQCDLTHGNCSCKYGVVGNKCDGCLDTFTGFSSSGCSLCNCSVNGSNSAVCNKTTGECPCKANSIGRTCGECKSGSFYLSGINSHGCLGCICMGITSNCTSIQGYYQQDQLPRYGWRIANETHLLGVSHSNGTIGSGSQSIPAVTATIPSQNRPLYWAAPSSFNQRSLVHSYGGYLQFSLTYSSASGNTVVRTQQVILKRNNLAIYYNLTMTADVVINVRRLRMHEDAWRYSNGSFVSRSTFLLILAKPSSLLVSASSYQSATGSYTARIGGLTISTVQSNFTAGGRAFQVEQCHCGSGYSGSSCERCALGYKRQGVSAHSYLGTCIPCECNGHSDQCDPDTGKCFNCQHNTTGDFCNQCLPGFYGNATVGTSSDCSRCPCEAPRTQSSLCEEDRNGTVRCLNCSTGYEGGATCDRCSLGFYGQPMLPGGSCQSCQCSNNSNICNTTSGVCQNCQFNTSGNHCERCRNGWYGDAISRTCQGCNCNLTGSVSATCNHTTGVCHCRPNVNGSKCTACQPNSYGFNVTGCTLCNCNPFGSLRLQCNESGICECRNHTVGSRCNACTLGYYGLPLQQCQACNCNLTGSVNQSCATSSGQCFCKPGVGGSQCDGCLKQYRDFNESGCTACGSCSMLLQRKINTEYTNVQRTYTNLQTTRLLSNLTPALLATEERFNTTQVAKQRFESRMTTLQSGINRIKSDSLNQSVTRLNNRANQLVARSDLLTTASGSEQGRIQLIRSEAEVAARQAISVNASLDAIISNLRGLRETSNSLLINAEGLNFTFASQKELGYAQSNESVALALLSRMQSALSNATAQKRLVDDISSNITELVTVRDMQERNLTVLQNEIAYEQQRLNGLLINITGVQRVIQATNATVNNISIDFNSLESMASNNSNVLSQARAVLQSANDTINNATGLRNSLDNLARLVAHVQANLTSARVTVNQATSYASNLTSQVNNLTSAFAGAKAHGANAVNAVTRYESISRLINQSMEVSSQANTSVQEVLRVLQQPGDQNLTRKATTSFVESGQVLEVSVNQRNTLRELQRNISLSNSTYRAVTAIGNRVSTRFSVFLSLVNSLSVTAELGNRPHSLEQSASRITSQANNVSDVSLNTLVKSQGLQQNISEMAATTHIINSTLATAEQALNLAWTTTNNITNKLNSTSNSPMDNINNITGLIQQFNASKAAVNSRLNSIQSKLAALKQRLGTLQTALRLNGSSSLVYRPSVSMLSPSAYSQLQMDFRTSQRNAMLMYFGNSSSASTTDKMSLKIVDAKVVFEYTVNGQQRKLTNWEVEVSDGFWRRVLATRQGDFSRLTVSVLATNLSRTYSLYDGSETSMMTIPIEAPIYLAALPAVDMINATALPFSGCIDNVRVNREQLSLWNYTSTTYRPSFCNSSQTVVSSDPTIPGASFAGNGFVQLNMGNFSIRNHSRVEFVFRTLHGNGTLFAVKGTRNSIVYSVVLQNDVIDVYTTNTRFTARQNIQSNGSYADGNSYRVAFERSTHSFYLSVTSLSTGAGPAPIVTNASLSLLDEGTGIFFGGVNATELGQLNTGNSFSGCISNARLSNNVTGGMDSVSLNDARLLQYFKGATFDGCLAQIQAGVRFLGNGYASGATPSQSLSTLEIDFRTTEPNGVIFFSEYQGAKFYISLYHGNIFIEFKNSSRNAMVSFFTRTQTLNNGQYHRLYVVFSGNTLMGVSIAGISSTKSFPTGLPPRVLLNGLIYFGGVPPSLTNSLMEFPVTSSFKGDFRRVLVNGIDYSKLIIAQSDSVSLAGVPLLQAAVPTPLPTTPPPTTLPPTCAASSPSPQFDTNINLIGIHSANSTLALRPPNEQTILSYLKMNFLLTIEFRAYSPYGVIFFATNNVTTQFISLELVDGQLVYKFNSGGGLVQMRTTQNYAQGQWTQVYLLRMSQFGAILVSSSQEYHNNRHGNGFMEMNIDFPFYLGSIPSNINLSMLTNPNGRSSFRGCIRDFKVQDASQVHQFDLSSHRDVSASKNLARCYASVIPMVRLSGTGYVLAERNLVTTSAFSVSLKFRTSVRNGVLWHLTSTVGGQSLHLELVSGQLALTHSNGGSTNQMQWIDPNIPFNRPSNMSFFLCNNAFHTIAVGRSLSNFTITVDSNPSVSASLGNINMNGDFYVGGSPSLGRNGLSGCLQSLILNGQAKDLASAASSPESRLATSGCAGS